MKCRTNEGRARRYLCVLGLFALLLTAPSCARSPKAEEIVDSAPVDVPVEKSAAAIEQPPPEPEVHYDFVDNLARCDAYHQQGSLVDLGSPAAEGIAGDWSLAPEEEPPVVERDGALWAEITTRTASFRFIQEISSPVSVLLRARGGSARRVSVSIGGQTVGVLSLARNQARILSSRSSYNPVSAGEQTISLRFIGPARPDEAFAEIDWIRIVPTNAPSSNPNYAPTLGEISYSATIGNIPHRAIALRAPGQVRCMMAIPKGARLRGVIGFAGPGQGDAEVRAVRDGEPPLLLGSFPVVGGEGASWQDFDIPLDRFSEEIVGIELAASSGAPGGRLLFGDPVIVAPRALDSSAPMAKLVVVVVLSSIERSAIPPFAPKGSLPALESLRRRSTVFLRHRSPSSVTSASLASLLTGMSPRRHGLEDIGAKLPDAMTTIAEAARDGSILTAMFTGSPTSFAAFGFDQGWDRFVAISPVSGISAPAPLTEAAAWISENMTNPDARGLLVVHARGGHPPWDVTPSEAADLLPPDYSGSIDPRRAAQAIGRARAKRARYRLTENDRVRMWELYQKGLEGQDRALHQLMEVLRKEELWEETMFIVTSDVGIPKSSRAPFGEGEGLEEKSLELPLWVHFAGGELQGLEVETPTTATDIASTVLGAFGLAVPSSFEGRDLYTIAQSPRFRTARPLGATLDGRYSVRWGDFVLHGVAGRSPSFCDLSNDPTCEYNRLEDVPLLSRAMFRWIWDADSEARRARSNPREPAEIDAETAAALSVWGL